MLLRLFPAGSRPYLVYTLGILLLGVTVACGGGAASTSTPTGEIPGPMASPPEEPTIKPTSTQHSLPSPTPSSIPQETLTPSAPPTQFTPATTPTSASSEVETPQPATPTDTPLPTLTSVPTPHSGADAHTYTFDHSYHRGCGYQAAQCPCAFKPCQWDIHHRLETHLRVE